VEALFKALAHALKEGASLTGDGVLSSKGVL
jgi:imidazoleglycerol phosphate dehydratase HisB